MSERKFKIRFKLKLAHFEHVFDIICLLVCVTLASGIISGQTRANIPNLKFINPNKTQSKKRIKIPKAQTSYGNVYELDPNITINKYINKTNINGYKYKVKRKKPLITYKSTFYLDPNKASTENEIKKPIYILLKGGITKKESTELTYGQTTFAKGKLLFDSNKHIPLDDSKTYIKVMQISNIQKVNKYNIVNTANDQLFKTSAGEGPIRYLKTKEFTLKRLTNKNLTSIALNGRLFSLME